MFIDKVKSYVRAGDGGKGCASLRHSRLRRFRVPDGGDGGRGGDIIIKVDSNLKGLLDFRYRQHFKARSGACGGSNKKKGKNGTPHILKVPRGTIIRDLGSGYVILRDLTNSDEEVVIAKGGEGGSGNSGRRVATQGEVGEVKELELELKLIADVGIIGFPNSGKSTLISNISNARPKIASYPFTTLAPVLGVVTFDDYRDIVICEVPGLIEDAHLGKGLGHSFLRHIERTKILVHLIDMAPPRDRDPFSDYKSLNRELKLYNPRLTETTQILAANKMDLPQAEANLKAFRSKVNKRVHPISAVSGEGLEELVMAIKGCFYEGEVFQGRKENSS